MKTYVIEAKSVSPLIFNTRQRDIDLELSKLKKDELSEWEENNWKRKAEINQSGSVILPIRWFRKSFTEACKFTKIVPHFASSKKQTYTKYSSSMIFQNSTFKCKVSDLKPFGSYVGAQGMNSSTKVWRIRPMIESWKCKFEIVDPAGRMLKEELKEILDCSGTILGIGDGRSVNFGRFEVISIKEK